MSSIRQVQFPSPIAHLQRNGSGEEAITTRAGTWIGQTDPEKRESAQTPGRGVRSSPFSSREGSPDRTVARGKLASAERNRGPIARLWWPALRSSLQKLLSPTFCNTIEPRFIWMDANTASFGTGARCAFNRDFRAGVLGKVNHTARRKGHLLVCRFQVLRDISAGRSVSPRAPGGYSNTPGRYAVLSTPPVAAPDPRLQASVTLASGAVTPTTRI